MKRRRMWNKTAAASYFGFAQKRELPSFTAQALASRACSGPRICQGPWLDGFLIVFTGGLGCEKINKCVLAKIAPLEKYQLS